MATPLSSTLMNDSSYTDTVSQALKLKRITRDFDEAMVKVRELQGRLDAADLTARKASVQHAADVARVERQRDEFCNLLQEKTNELAATFARVQKLEEELQSANETIARLETDLAMRSTDPLHIQVREGNAYDTLLEQAVKSSGDQGAFLVDRYRNIETQSSNMTWETFLNETLLKVWADCYLLVTGYEFSKMPTVESTVKEMVKNKSLQPPLIRYVQRHSEFEKVKTKKMTKAQMETFNAPMRLAFKVLVDAWITHKKKHRV